MISISHTIHIPIPFQEDDIVTRVGNSKESFISRILEGEVQRNRHRVAEINHFLENIRDELEQYENLDR